MVKVISGSGKRGNRGLARRRRLMYREFAGVLGHYLADVEKLENRDIVSLVGLLEADSVLACPGCSSTPLQLALARLSWSCTECLRYGRLVLVGEDPAEAWTVVELITDGRERDE